MAAFRRVDAAGNHVGPVCEKVNTNGLSRLQTCRLCELDQRQVPREPSSTLTGSKGDGSCRILQRIKTWDLRDKDQASLSRFSWALRTQLLNSGSI